MLLPTAGRHACFVQGGPDPRTCIAGRGRRHHQQRAADVDALQSGHEMHALSLVECAQPPREVGMKRAYELATLLMTLASCGAGFGRKYAGHCKFAQNGKNSVSTCNKAFHMRCLDQPLLEVPRGTRFCPECTMRRSALRDGDSIGCVDKEGKLFDAEVVGQYKREVTLRYVGWPSYEDEKVARFSGQLHFPLSAPSTQPPRKPHPPSPSPPQLPPQPLSRPRRQWWQKWRCACGAQPLGVHQQGTRTRRRHHLVASRTTVVGNGHIRETQRLVVRVSPARDQSSTGLGDFQLRRDD